MSSWSQWYKTFTENPSVKWLTLVYGPEQILVDHVVDSIRSHLSTEPWNLVVLDTETDSEKKIWDEARLAPFGVNGKRLSIVRNAEKLSPDKLLHYYADRRKLTDHYLVLVFSTPDLPREEGRRDLLPHIEEIRNGAKSGKTQFIHCRPFTESTSKYAVRWVQDTADIPSGAAAHLLNRANGDLRLVRDVLKKLSVVKTENHISAINAILAERPNDTFLGALFSLDKKVALKALKELPKSEWSRTLGLIDARLDLAGYVHGALLEHKSPGEIARGAGAKSFLVPDILPVAKYYDIKRRQKIRELLALIDEYADSGIPNGAFEVLVHFW